MTDNHIIRHHPSMVVLTFPFKSHSWPMDLSRTKVLLLIPDLEGGGAQRVFCTLLQHLDRGRFELHLALLGSAGPALQTIPEDIVVHRIRASRVRYALPGIVRVAREVKPKIILSTLANMNFFAILVKPLFPRGTQLFVRDAVPPSTLFRNKAMKRLWRILYPPVYRRADKIVCLSDSLADEVVGEYRMPREKVVRIYNPVDIERVRSLGNTGENPYAGPGPQLVAVGRLCEQKGFDLLLEALPAVQAVLPGVRLAILGEGELLAKLQAQARRLGIADAVRFCGFQENPWLFIRHADVFVLSSRYEGMPNVLLEAMALGKPIVAADCPGAIREMQRWIPSMRVVASGEPRALAQAIVAACTMAKTNKNGNATDDACYRFGVERIVEEYSALFLS